MGKMSRSNMSIEVKDKLDQIVQPGNYYVDAGNGNDSNDGRSPSTAWKTTAKLNEYFSSKVCSGGITVHLSEGSHGSIELNDLNCERIFITGAGSDKTYIRSTSQQRAVNLYSVTYIIFSNLTMTANTDSSEKAVFLINANNSKFIEIADSVVMNGTELDSNGTAVNVVLVETLYLRCKFLSLATPHAIAGSLNTGIVMVGAYFDQSYNIYIGTGSKYAVLSYAEGTVTPAIHPDTSSDFINKTQQGIIIETSGNINGRYVRFADGTVMFSTWVIIEPLEDTFFAANHISRVTFATPVQSVYPYMTISQHGGTGFGHLADYRVDSIDANTYTIGFIPTIDILPGTSFGFNVISLGRWK